MCGSSFSVILEYEYFQINARKEIDRRNQSQDCYFSAWELSRIIFDLVDLFSFLQSNNINHGEINPTLIFLAEDLDSGVLRPKVCERLSGCGDKFINSLQGYTDKKELYVCPLLFSVIVAGYGNNRKCVDSYKSEVFSLGKAKKFSMFMWRLILVTFEYHPKVK